MAELLCERIRRLRQERHIRVCDFAKGLNISRQAIEHWEAGKDYPSLSRIPKMAALLGVTIDYLLTGREAPHHAALLAAVRRAGTRDPLLAALIQRPVLNVLVEGQ